MKKIKVILIGTVILPLLKIIFFPLTIVTVGLSFLASDCDTSTPQPPWHTTPYEIGKPSNTWWPKMNIPADNPMTVEGVTLGRYLFYDGRLSGRLECDSQMSCATCHMQKNSFEVGMDNPRFPGGRTKGIPDAQYPNGKYTPHYMLPLINLVFNHNGYLWNGMIHSSNPNLGSVAYKVPALPQYHMKNIESLVWMGIAAQHEMNSTIEKSVNMIKSIKSKPNYSELFKAAFGDEEITYDRISKAIAQFVRSLVSYNSKYHKWIRKEINRLSDNEYRGYTIFMSEKGDCFHCHGDPVLLTTNLFYNNGLDSIFNDTRDRYAYTKNPMDKGVYKAPTLINCELTAPYMHDGRYKTLEEVVDHYSDMLVYSNTIDPLMKWVAYGGTMLKESEKADLIAFLKTLTDWDFVSNPAFSKPADLDTGCD